MPSDNNKGNHGETVGERLVEVTKQWQKDLMIHSVEGSRDPGEW